MKQDTVHHSSSCFFCVPYFEKVTSHIKRNAHALSSIRTVFGHGLHNFCHRENEIIYAPAPRSWPALATVT